MEQKRQNMQDEKEEKKAVSGLLFAAAAGIGVYIFLRYLFPLVSPFLLSFCIVYLLDPWMERVRGKTHMRKEILLAGILLLAVTVVLLILWLLLQAGTFQIGTLSENWDGISARVSGQIRIFFGDCCMFVENHLGIDADRVEQAVLERMDVLVEELRVELVPKLMTESWWYVRKLLSVGAFLGIALIASVLMCRDFDHIMKGITQEKEGGGAILPQMLQILERVIHLAAVFLKTQGVIMITVAALCSVGLWIGKVKNALLLGILAGVLDALPFIGTGIILIPTVIWQLICGNYGTAVWCLVLYVICIIARELLEPRLMGEKTGIYPVFMLLAVYAGLKLFGVSGVVKGPFALVLMTELWNFYTKRRTN